MKFQNMLSAKERVQQVENAFPPDGLFRGKKWLISPEPFPLNKQILDELTLLGEALHAFNRSCNRLYRESAMGNQPTWVAELLDKGKPQYLIDFSRKACFANAVSKVIRPDVILGEDGIYVTEIDSLPGGIGVTAWMNKTYFPFDDKIVGGEFNMIDSFARLLDGGDVIISREAQDYKPEMLWITREILNRHASGAGYRVIDTLDFAFQDKLRHAYRYFELWDLDNVENADEFMRLAESVNGG